MDSQGLKHIIWYDNDYVLIDANFDGAQTDTVLGPVKVDLKVDAKYKDGTIYRRHHRYDSGTSISDDDKIELSKGLFLKAKAGYSEDGFLTGFHFCCTAVELFDGSFILHSAPVLLCPPLDASTRYNDSESNYIDNKVTWYAPNFSIASVPDVGYFELSRYYIKYATSVGTVHSAESPGVNMFCTYESVSSKYYLNCISACNVLKYKSNIQILDSLKPLIKSVSVFMTSDINLYDYTSVDKTITLVNEGSMCFTPTPKPMPKYSKNYQKRIQQFYKVHEITFDELQTITPDTWIPIDLKGKLGDNLKTREVLPVDDFTHHQLVPQQQMTYNSRLHAMDYKTVLSRGWPHVYMQAITGVGQFQANNSTTAGASVFRYISVKIKTETGISIVTRGGLRTGISLTRSDLSPMLSYPDSRAFEMTIHECYITSFSPSIGFINTKTVKLTPSDNQNFAFLY